MQSESEGQSEGKPNSFVSSMGWRGKWKWVQENMTECVWSAQGQRSSEKDKKTDSKVVVFTGDRKEMWHPWKRWMWKDLWRKTDHRLCFTKQAGKGAHESSAVAEDALGIPYTVGMWWNCEVNLEFVKYSRSVSLSVVTLLSINRFLISANS